MTIKTIPSLEDFLKETDALLVDGKRYYQPRQLAHYLGISERTVARWIKQGKFDEFDIEYTRNAFNNRILITENGMKAIYSKYFEPMKKNKSLRPNKSRY